MLEASGTGASLLPQFFQPVAHSSASLRGRRVPPSPARLPGSPAWNLLEAAGNTCKPRLPAGACRKEGSGRPSCSHGRLSQPPQTDLSSCELLLASERRTRPSAWPRPSPAAELVLVSAPSDPAEPRPPPMINELPATALLTGLSHKRRAAPRGWKADVASWALTSQSAPRARTVQVELTLKTQGLPTNVQPDRVALGSCLAAVSSCLLSETSAGCQSYFSTPTVWIGDDHNSAFIPPVKK